MFTNREVARILLVSKCGDYIANNKMSKLFKACYNYLFNGCDDNEEYKYLVKELFKDDYKLEWCINELMEGEK